MMRYVVWHVERSGSNMLMNLLSQTGYAGLSDYENCGYFIGYQALTEAAYQALDRSYFDKQRTANGVEGCKAALSYLQDIERLVSWQASMDWFAKFDKHVVLKRRDIVAQAVSFLFASTTKAYTSAIQSDKAPPDYDYDRIAHIIAEIEGRYARLDAFLTLQRISPLVVYYEDIVTMQALILQRILNHLDIRETYAPIIAGIQKQSDSLKTAYIERFKQECNSIS